MWYIMHTTCLIIAYTEIGPQVVMPILTLEEPRPRPSFMLPDLRIQVLEGTIEALGC